MTPNPLTPCPSSEPLFQGGQAAQPIFRTALVIDPEALEGRLMAEAPSAKRRRHSGGFSPENAGLLDNGSLSGETEPATPQTNGS